MFKTKITPEQRAAKANARVNKALAVFEDAANELDLAANEHLVVEAELLDAANAALLAADALTDAAEGAYYDGLAKQEQASKLRSLLAL